MNTFIAMLYWYIRCNLIGGIDMNTNIKKHINQVWPKATPTLYASTCLVWDLR
jgi:hypothetical protein